MLRSWFIKILGGYLEEDKAGWCIEVQREKEKLESFRQGLIAEAQYTRQTFYSILDAKDREIQRLTNLMLQEHGLLRGNDGEALRKSTEMKPFNKRISWKERQEQLTRDAAKKQADSTKEHWDKKNASSTGTGAA